MDARRDQRARARAKRPRRRRELLRRAGARRLRQRRRHAATPWLTRRRRCEKLGVAVQRGGHDLARIARSALVVASPGVPPDAPPLAAARDGRGADRRASSRSRCTSCRTALHRDHRHERQDDDDRADRAQLLAGSATTPSTAGNIGTPLAEVALRERQPDWIALEMSSFQLHDTPSIAPTRGRPHEPVGEPSRPLRRASTSTSATRRCSSATRTSTRVWVTQRRRRRGPADGAGRARHASARSPRGAGAADGYFDRARVQLVVLGAPLIDRAASSCCSATTTWRTRWRRRSP